MRIEREYPTLNGLLVETGRSDVSWHDEGNKTCFEEDASWVSVVSVQPWSIAVESGAQPSESSGEADWHKTRDETGIEETQGWYC